jgi:hypothetical protein
LIQTIVGADKIGNWTKLEIYLLTVFAALWLRAAPPVLFSGIDRSTIACLIQRRPQKKENYFNDNKDFRHYRFSRNLFET